MPSMHRSNAHSQVSDMVSLKGTMLQCWTSRAPSGEVLKGACPPLADVRRRINPNVLRVQNQVFPPRRQTVNTVLDCCKG